MTEHEPEIRTVFDPATGMEAVVMDCWVEMGIVPTAEAVAAAEAREGKTYTGPIAPPPEMQQQLADLKEVVEQMLLDRTASRADPSAPEAPPAA